MLSIKLILIVPILLVLVFTALTTASDEQTNLTELICEMDLTIHVWMDEGRVPLNPLNVTFVPLGKRRFEAEIEASELYWNGINYTWVITRNKQDQSYHRMDDPAFEIDFLPQARHDDDGTVGIVLETSTIDEKCGKCLGVIGYTVLPLKLVNGTYDIEPQWFSTTTESPLIDQRLEKLVKHIDHFESCAPKPPSSTRAGLIVIGCVISVCTLALIVYRVAAKYDVCPSKFIRRLLVPRNELGGWRITLTRNRSLATTPLVDAMEADEGENDFTLFRSLPQKNQPPLASHLCANVHNATNSNQQQKPLIALECIS